MALAGTKDTRASRQFEKVQDKTYSEEEQSQNQDVS